jgi:hypothetical protein
VTTCESSRRGWYLIDLLHGSDCGVSELAFDR